MPAVHSRAGGRSAVQLVARRPNLKLPARRRDISANAEESRNRVHTKRPDVQGRRHPRQGRPVAPSPQVCAPQRLLFITPRDILWNAPWSSGKATLCGAARRSGRARKDDALLRPSLQPSALLGGDDGPLLCLCHFPRSARLLTLSPRAHRRIGRQQLAPEGADDAPSDGDRLKPDAAFLARRALRRRTLRAPQKVPHSGRRRRVRDATRDVPRPQAPRPGRPPGAGEHTRPPTG